MKSFLLYAFLFLVTLTAQSQDSPWINNKNNGSIKKISQEVTDDGYVYYKESAKIKHDNVFSKNKEAYGLSGDDIMKLARTVDDNLKGKHYCYQQYYKGICVEGGEYLVHTDDEGMVESTNGYLVENISQNVKAEVAENKALLEALKAIGAKKYAWQDTTWEHQIKLDLEDENATYYPKGELVFARKPGKEDYKKDSYLLAYKFDITSVEPFQHLELYVDANQGKVLKSISQIHEGSGNTLYNGTQNFAVDHAGLINYRLHANLPGAEHHTKASSGPGGTAWVLVSEYKDGDGNWGNSDRHAVSAHWAAERSWSYYINVHARAGMFNGYKLRIHPRLPQENAFYNRDNGFENIYVGSNLSTLDIMGHEYTHGVVRASSNLVYQGESGALNESFADIFGVAIERDAGGGLDWTVGEDWRTIRSLQNPRGFGDPDTYLGLNWANTGAGTPDNGGVHTNSGVQNRWFFLLSQGGTQNGVAVAGIGFDNAIRVAYRTLTVYLTSTSNYAAARAGSIRAANDLFGTCSAQTRAVTNAWAAVGVGAVANCTPPPPPITASISGPTSLAQNVSGTFTATASGGTGTYTYQWTANGRAAGTSRTMTERIRTGESSLDITLIVRSGGIQRTVTKYVSCTNCSGGPGGPPVDPQIRVSIFPNPTSDEINVELRSEDSPAAAGIEETSYSIYDDRGNIIYQITSSDPKQNFDTRRLPSGTYYVEVANKEGILRERIYIKKQ